ncbi:unnamed protein product [Symbiodinium natans]|uniref:PDZ domain-containing protein n=1 Tax=Symbiodinium natans TaxID=878477 RepID=A0A812S5N1_9DINO|nr:unnamed protein product [Symbiodinium natans]
MDDDECTEWNEISEGVALDGNHESHRFKSGCDSRDESEAFLRDVLRHCAVLFHTVQLDKENKEEDKYDYFEVFFDHDDAPPLGLRIRWELPPQLTEVLPNTPAARAGEELRPGDQLVEVNGGDVTELEQGDIAPMFEARPLKLLFRRKPEPVEEVLDEGSMKIVGNIRVEEVSKVSAYGDSAQYLECFNLAVLVVHNLAVQASNLELLHSEPRILMVLLEVMPADATSPSLRRLIFSTLTCLCQERAVSGRIFHAMANYFQNCQKTDASLHKYIMCYAFPGLCKCQMCTGTFDIVGGCANLYYTSMSREEVKPDRGMLMFVSRISAEEAYTPDIQIRAFESMYFCTMGACAPELWSDLEILPRMVRAAGYAQSMADESPSEPLLRQHADALWEISLRTLHHCLRYELLVHQMRIPDLDRYLMELLVDGRKPPELSKVAADLIAGLLQSSISSNLWTRWRGLGVGERLVGWFKVHRKKLLDPDLGVHAGTQPADSLDAMPLRRSFYDSDRQHRPTADEVAKADASFRIIAQLLTALVANEHGLSVPVMLVLCAMSSNKASSQVLMTSEKFVRVLRRMEKKLATLGEAPPVKDEVEYLVCILDRSCCHADLAKIAQDAM